MSNPFSFEKTILIHVFPRKQDLTFHANQKIGLHFMQIAYIRDNMYEMSNLPSGKNCLLFSLLELCSGRAIMMDLLSLSVYASVNIFKQLLLWSRWANFALFSYGASLARENKRLRKRWWSMTKMAAMSIYCKTFKNLLLQNQCALGLNICSDLSSGRGGLLKLLKWWSYIDIWPFYGEVKFASLCIHIGPHLYGKKCWEFQTTSPLRANAALMSFGASLG